MSDSGAGYVEQNVGKSSEGIYYDDGRDRTISSKEADRRQLEEAMAAFLNGGGTIKAIEPNVRADPPRKPESNYGSRPI